MIAEAEWLEISEHNCITLAPIISCAQGTHVAACDAKRMHI